MAVIKTPSGSSLRMRFQTGTDLSGNPVYRTKSLTNQIDTMIDADILGAVIEKFVSPTINLSPNPILNDQGEVKLPGLDNHTMNIITNLWKNNSQAISKF